MDLEQQIKQYQREGKVTAEEASELSAALSQSQAEDTLLLQRLSERRSSRRIGKFFAQLSFIALISAITSLIYIATYSASETSISSNSAIPSSAEGLNQVIDTLEQKLRKPGKAADYNMLAEAYRRRYQSSNDKNDLTASERARTRAEGLFNKTEKEGVMGKNVVVFGLLFVIVIVAGIGLVVMFPYNSLAKKDENVDARWSQVETVLQRRLDLIPNLVETVKGYAGHEQETLLAVTEARAKVLSALGGSRGKAPSSDSSIAELDAAEKGLSSSLSKLFALVENYPDIKASSNFLALQDQLEGTENRVAIERQRYNEAIRALNSSLRTFPSNVIGSMFGFEARAYFESQLGAEKVVPVSFSN